MAPGSSGSLLAWSIQALAILTESLVCGSNIQNHRTNVNILTVLLGTLSSGRRNCNKVVKRMTENVGASIIMDIIFANSQHIGSCYSD